jgi:creatinine amidohydrolase/Fe(II)-dependent formamide hydrolase-like protein
MEQNMENNELKEKRPYLLGELTWPEAAKRFKEVDIALLPIGSVEQHGPHLPLDTDAFDAEFLSHQVAKRCSDPKPIVLPLIPYGVSYHHEDFSGTISVSPESLSKMVHDIGMSIVNHGIKKLIIINGHGGNSPALHFAAQMINRDTHIFTCVESGETSDTDIDSLIQTPNDVHAGEIETSTSLASRPYLTNLEKAEKYIPRFSSRYLNFSSKRSVGWYARTASISKSGVLGDPTKANPEKGEKIWELMIKNLVEFIEDLKGMSLKEIYQKRY